MEWMNRQTLSDEMTSKNEKRRDPTWSVFVSSVHLRVGSYLQSQNKALRVARRSTVG